MSTTLNELVRDQILAEGSQMETAREREYYLNGVLCNMPTEELLERISYALERARTQFAVNPLLR